MGESVNPASPPPAFLEQRGKKGRGNKPEDDICIAAYFSCKTNLCVLEEWFALACLSAAGSVSWTPWTGWGQQSQLTHPMEGHPQSPPTAATEAAEGWQR